MTVPDTKSMVLDLLRGAAPERADEISALWRRYRPEFEVVPDRAGITMNANKHRIQFDLKTLEVLWLIGFCGWKSIETYTPLILTAMLTQGVIDEVLVTDQDLGPFEQDYKHRIVIAHSFIDSDNSVFGEWPPDIPRPQSDRASLKDAQDQAAFDLTCMASAYVFLHEFRHVMFAQDGSAPSRRPEEELACDVWARGILTDKLAVYAKGHGHDYQRVLNKRAMGMALGSLILHTITPPHARWGTGEYPPIAERMDALIKGSNLPDNASFWMLAASILVGVMRQSHRPIDIAPQGAKALVAELIERMR
ncbi:hypothetical protein J2X04_001294 [Lysobacter niabensis]|uniref:Peptidase U49 n=1 Tax=Agrilutibacter niabensis TaxID=380628 RepID=A0ABU1VN91_9GAMM|nr:phage exclusion protein Lit family protein [Lysobacter niabensis]MDR7098947.1 hypothetical protein [Lysobacter niabensis]